MTVVIEGDTLLPQVAFPDLTETYVACDGCLGWLQGSHEARLGQSERVTFHSKSEQIGDFLVAFANVALTVEHHAASPSVPQFSASPPLLLAAFTPQDFGSISIDTASLA